MANRISNLLMSDHKYIWKPFASTGAWMAEEPLIIEESRDCFIKDIRGHWYIDGLSSTWVTIHDRNRAEINDAIRSQLDKFAHPTLPIPGNVPSILLAERLAKLLRKSLGKGAPSRVSYAGDGATAIESALKMAFQYWQSKGKKRKKAFISFSGSYHGDTLGALSLSGIDIFRKDFAPLLFKTYFSHYPYCYRCWNNKHPDDCGLLCLEVLDKLLKVRQEEVAALIIEPLIQSEGGMIPAPEGFLSGVRSLCRRYHVLLIADEGATGFGRTGKMFACEHEKTVPDIICLSMGSPGGCLPLAFTAATDEIYSSLDEFPQGPPIFFQRHAHTRDPFSCACALACLDVFDREETLKKVRPKIRILKKWFNKASKYPHVGECRNAGFMAGVELVKNRETKEPYHEKEKIGWAVAKAALDEGILVRPLGNVLAVTPPLAVSEENLKQMLEGIGRAIRKTTESGNKTKK